MYSYDEQRLKISKIGEKIKSSFNIENNLLLNVSLFILDQNRKCILITAHHLIIDGVSWGILAEDICTLFKQIKSNQSLKLPFKTHSFKKWADTFNDENYLETDKSVEYFEESSNDSNSNTFLKKFSRKDTYAKSIV